MVHPKKEDHRRLVWLSEDDLSAAARLLAAISDSSAVAGGKSEDKTTSARTASRSQALRQATLSLYLRQRRVQRLGRMFVNEPPFQLLLSLYVNEHRERDMTITRLADRAWLSQSTTLRWVDELITGEWISRTNAAEDRRKSILRLTEKAHQVLDDLFAWPE